MFIVSSYAHKAGRSNKQVNKEDVCVKKFTVIETDVYIPLSEFELHV
jgi:hypothetical protein